MTSLLSWTAAAVLAAVLLSAGLLRIVRPHTSLAAMGRGRGGVPTWAARATGVVEVAGALGLVLPAALGIAPCAAAWTALGLAIVMPGATVLHLVRREPLTAAATLVLVPLAAAVAWLRLGPPPF